MQWIQGFQKKESLIRVKRKVYEVAAGIFGFLGNYATDAEFIK